MKFRSLLAAGLALCLLVLAGCARDTAAVYVQSVASITGSGAVAPGDWFPGMVVAENVTEIQRDSDKGLGELFVKVGQDVTQGQELFSYDTQALQLNVDKQKLELEQLQATAENYRDQIAELEAERDKASSDSQLQYTVQIQSTQVELKETELNIQNKEKEIAQSESLLENGVVVSPVDGRIQAINESGMDSYGNPAAYITIQQAGSYRIQGTIGELQMGAILEGARIRAVSRTDESQVWMGTVSYIDYENAAQGDSYGGMIYPGGDTMTTGSKYPFYVVLDDTQGLILGQHVYLMPDTGEAAASGLPLSSYFIAFDEDGGAYVWAENKGRLEKRPLELGEYDPMTDAYPVLSGLTAQDYIAFPDPELCREGAPTTRQEPAQEPVQEPGGNSGMIAPMPVPEGGVE